MKDDRFLGHVVENDLRKAIAYIGLYCKEQDDDPTRHWAAILLKHYKNLTDSGEPADKC